MNKDAAFLALDLVTMNSLPEAKLELSGIGAAEGEADDFVRALDKNIDNFDNFFKASDDVVEGGAIDDIGSVGSKLDDGAADLGKAVTTLDDAVDDAERVVKTLDDKVDDMERAASHIDDNMDEAAERATRPEDVDGTKPKADEPDGTKPKADDPDAETRDHENHDNHSDNDGHENHEDTEEHGQHGEDDFDGDDTDEDDWDFNLEDDINDGILYGDELTNSMNSEPLEVETSVSGGTNEGGNGSFDNTALLRGDDALYTNVRANGIPKSYIDGDGSLIPANPNGIYNGRQVSVTEHILGGYRRGAKGNSPYTSFSFNDSIIQGYGNSHIEVDISGLRKAIQSGEVTDVAILSPKQIEKLIINDTTQTSYWKNKALSWTQRDSEYLIRGIIPKEFIKVIE